MKLTAKHWLAFVCLLAGIIALFGVPRWKQHIKISRQLALRKEIRVQYDQGNYRKAVALLNESEQMRVSEPGEEESWIRLKLDVASRARDPQVLEELSKSHHEELLDHESASLTWARFLMHGRRTDEFEEVRSHWKSRGDRDAEWLILDVGKYLLEERVADARALLDSHQFSGESEAMREVYRALLESNPSRAFEHLAAAYREAPKNADVRTFAGNLFEYFGDAVKARREYVAAYLCDPENPITRDNLAEFYLRRGNIELALETWAPREPGERIPETLWIKYHFWILLAGRGDELLTAIPSQGGLGKLVRVLSSASPEVFWSIEAMAAVKSATGSVEPIRPHLHWLEILQALLDRNEAEALDLLYAASERDVAMAPLVARGLKVILNYRQTGNFVSGGGELEGGISFLKRLLEKKLDFSDAELLELIKSDHAFTTLFLATGWSNFALRVEDVYSDSKPPFEWLKLGLAQAQRYCRGNRAAIRFIEGFPEPSPSLQVLLGELYIGEGRTTKGMEHLQVVCRDSGGAGFRASWLLGIAYLEKDEFAEAREVLSSHQGLQRSVVGIELAARICLAEGEEKQCEQLYRSIVERSVESKVFFARKAFKKRDWDAARDLTKGAIQLAPNLAALHENLRHIEAAANQLTQ